MGGEIPTLFGNNSKYLKIILSTTAGLGEFAENGLYYVHIKEKTKGERVKNNCSFHLLLQNQKLQWLGNLVVLGIY